MCSICPPFCCTTALHHTRPETRYVRSAAWERPVRWARDVAAKINSLEVKFRWLRRVGYPAADSLPPSKFRLSWWTTNEQLRRGRWNSVVVPGQEHRRMASSSWRRDAAEWRTTVLPSVIWNNDSYLPDGATVYIINFSKLHFRVKNETTLNSAKNCVDLSSISEVRSYITERGSSSSSHVRFMTKTWHAQACTM